MRLLVVRYVVAPTQRRGIVWDGVGRVVGVPIPGGVDGVTQLVCHGELEEGCVKLWLAERRWWKREIEIDAVALCVAIRIPRPTRRLFRR
jgi:hypothetical protein